MADFLPELPDDVLLRILNLIGDVRSLALCCCTCRRLAAIVPQTDRLLLRVDAVVPHQPDLPLLHRLIASLLENLTFYLLSYTSPKASATSPPPRRRDSESSSCYSPEHLLRGFHAIRTLEIELPGGNLRLPEKGAVLRWHAVFGRTLRSCVILAAREMAAVGGEAATVEEEEDWLKERVIWTIGALIAASARHHMVRGVLREGMERLVVRDRDGEGTLVVEKEGLEEWRGTVVEDDGGGAGRTTVPAMEMRMRHARVVEAGGGVRLERAMLVVAKEADVAAARERDEVSGAFGDGAFRCAAEELLKSASYTLEMNSF